MPILPMILSIPIVSALVIPPKPAAIRTFRDWSVTCDNVLSCTAAVLMPEDSAGEEDYVPVLVERTALPGSPVKIEVSTREASWRRHAIPWRRI
jgi:hypothetical protein